MVRYGEVREGETAALPAFPDRGGVGHNRRLRKFKTRRSSDRAELSARTAKHCLNGERHMTTNTKKVSRGAGERRPSRKNPVPLPPLSWWRTIRAEHFDATIAKLLREHLAVVAIFGKPAWDAAVAGDAAAAIGMASF